MIIHPTLLDGIFEINNKKFEDYRGLFIKTFHEELFKENGLEYSFKESFYSISRKNVLRGMHFQLQPHDHAKLVYVTSGEILDVVVDIREKSPTFGSYYSTKLSFENAKTLYIARGFAHGFLTLSEQATVVYLTTSIHSPESDSGIRWDSFNFNWGTSSPILSNRDKNFMLLSSINDYEL